jgi:outer membrane protein
MTFKTFAAGAAAAAVALGSATIASAQAAAPAAPPITHGAPIPGMCVISVEGVIGNSTVGGYVNTRLQQIGQQVNAELGAEQTAIQNDDKALSGQRATLDPATFDQRASALQVRANSFQRKAQLRDREMQATEQKALGRIGQEMEPLIRQAYQQKGCSMLVNRQAIVIANPAMDLTPAVTTALNGKLTQFAFDREHLDQAGGGGAPEPVTTAPAAPRPATRK